MSLTYLDLQNQVLFNTLGERFRAPVKTWLLDAVRVTSRRLRIQKTACVGTTDSSGIVSLSTAFWNVAEVYTVATSVSAGAVPLSSVEQFANRRLAPMIASSGSQLVPNTGTPMAYEAISQNAVVALRVLPVPAVGTKVAVVGHSYPTAMSIDSDTSGLVQELDEALIAFCRARAFRREDDFQMAQMWDAEYIAGLRSVLPSNIQNTDGPNVTPGTDGYGDPWTGGG